MPRSTCWKYYCLQQCHRTVCIVNVFIPPAVILPSWLKMLGRHKLNVQCVLGVLLSGGVPLTLLLSILTNSLPPDLISLQSEAIFLHRYESWLLTLEIRFCPVFVSSCFPKTGLLMIKLPAAPCSLHISVHWSQNWKEWMISYFNNILICSKKAS